MRKPSTVPVSKAPLSRKISRLIDVALRCRDQGEQQTATARPRAVKELAGKIGVGYQSLAYYLSARNNVPAYILPAICTALNDFAPLNALEHVAGRVAFPIPSDLSGGPNKANVMRIQKLIKEVGEALEALSDTLADGIVEEHEVETTTKELRDVVRECLSLEHWLVERYAADRAKRPRAKSA